MCNLINTHTHTHTHDNGNENRIGEDGREAKKRKKPQYSCRRREGNGGDTGGKRKKCRKERVGSVAANPDNLESIKEAWGGAQGAQGSSKICTENRIGEDGREAKKRKKPQYSCRRREGNGGDTGGKRKKCRKERVGSVAANPDNLESIKEAWGGAQGAQGSSKICTSRESVSPLSRLIRGFRNKYHCEWHRMTRTTGPDCAVMCNLTNTHTHTHTHSIIDPPSGGSMRVA